MKRTNRIVATTLALAAVASAQQTPTAAAEKLARAVVTEELEHDVGAAIDRYRAVAESTETADPVRARAWLRLGLALNAIGKTDEGIQALTVAARDEGETGRRARAALQDPQGKAVLEARVTAGIEVLAAPPGKYAADVWSEAMKELIWIGAPAVPYLVRRAEAADANLDFIDRASGVLLQIGGEPVVAWLGRVGENADGLTKRRVVRAFNRQFVTDQAVRNALTAFVDDADPLVRSDALQTLYMIVPAKRVIARAGDPDARVRETALSLVVSKWQALQHTTGQADSATLLIPHLDRAMGQPDSAVGRRVLQALQMQAVLQNSDGRRLFLRAIALPAFRDAKLNHTWRCGPAEHVDEVVALAKQLGRVQPGVDGSRPHAATRPQQLLGQFVVISCTYGRWTRDALPGVLELVSLGYAKAVGLDDFVVQVGTADDVAAVLARLGDFRDVQKIGEWLADKELPNDVPPELIAWVRNDLVPEVVQDAADINSGWRKILGGACAPIGRVASPQAVAFLEEVAASAPAYAVAVDALMRGRGDHVTAALKRLLVLDVEDPQVPWARNQLFRRLLADGVADADYGTAYRLGLTRNQRGLAYWTRQERGTFDGPDMARVVDGCLATRLPAVWDDLFIPVRPNQTLDQNRRGLPDELYTVLCRRVEECPEQSKIHRNVPLRREFRRYLARACFGVPGHREMVLSALADPAIGRDIVGYIGINTAGVPDAEMVAASLRYLEDADDNVVRNTIWVLRRSGDTTTVARIQPLLTHRNPWIRTTAADALIALAPGRTVEWIRPLAADAEQSGRVYFCQQSQALVDRAVVPDLLRLLRDPDGAVREAAAAALQAIEFYDEQNRRWNRILDASGLDATSAAEALVRKAKTGKQTIRLAAIESLGTLGVAETLPFLLELMSDTDAEIATAARAALQKINAAGAGKK